MSHPETPITSLEQARAIAKKAVLDSFYGLQPQPEPEPEPGSTVAELDPVDYGLTPEAVQDEQRQAIAAAEEAARIRAKQNNLRELAAQALVDKGEIKSVQDVAEMPTQDVLVLAGFAKSPSQLRLEREVAEMNDPALAADRERADATRRLIDGWNWTDPDVRAKEAARLGLDAAAIHQSKIDEANRGF